MTRNAVIGSRDITEYGISRIPFREASYIGSRKTGLEVAAEREVIGGALELCSVFKGALNTVSTDRDEDLVEKQVRHLLYVPGRQVLEGDGQTSQKSGVHQSGGYD